MAGTLRVAAYAFLATLAACSGGGGGGDSPGPATTTASSSAGLTAFPANSFIPSQPAGSDFTQVSETDLSTTDGSTYNVGRADDGTGGTSSGSAEITLDPDTSSGKLRYLTLKVNDGTATYTHSFDLSTASASPLSGYLQVVDTPQSGGTYQHTLVIDPNLSYSAYGVWLNTPATGTALQTGAYSVGQWTPAANVPTTGTASYSGSTVGLLVQPSGGYVLSGDASLTANFAAMTVAGSLTNMKAINNGTGVSSAWDNMAMSANISGNGYNGSIASSSTSTLTPGALNGAVSGHFYGPHAEETGGTWWATDGSSTAAVGSFGAKKN